MIFGINSLIIFKKNLIVNPSAIKKSYGEESTDFHGQEMSKVGSKYICLAVILMDFVLTKVEIYYPKVFLKEFKYLEKERKAIKHIASNLDIFLMILMTIDSN